MEHRGTQTLRTERLLLRRFRMEDTDQVFENWAGDARVSQFVSWNPHPDREVTRVQLSTWMELYDEETTYHWGIELHGQLVGDIAVVRLHEPNSTAEIGFLLSPDRWGEGIMTEALGGVMAFLFGVVGVHRIELRHDAQNIGSGRVMIKNGMIHEGTLRKAFHRRDGSFGDLHLYGLLREEFMDKEGAYRGNISR